MKQFFSNIKNIIIVALIVIIMIMQQCSGPMFDFNLFGGKTPDPVEGTVITKIETRWDTVKIDSIVYQPRWRTRVDTVHDTTLRDVDTMSVLKDYYAKYEYKDTIDLDTLGHITIQDTITQNMIISRIFDPTITVPTKTITRDSLISKNEFYYGLGIAGNRQQFSYVGGELLYRSKRKRVIGAGLGINQNLQPVISLRMMWKIGR